jgi:ESX secretion-associated protein EspC/F
MARLVISSTILETLAKNQETAAKDAQAAAGDLDGTGSDCWISHGVISGSSDGAFDTIEGIRKAAGTALADASLRMAAKLRAADKAYKGVNSELGANFRRQMRDK